ncbi:MAG TPA: ParA family protein [Syntrophorhabdaceae bacterium]|nr:ParA family protein [Syntrophorhabdaceae bacterium]
MGIIATIANHKGGVGKSTLVYNLSRYLLKYYPKILVLDFDPQANTTWWLSEYADEIKVKIHDILKYGVTYDFQEKEYLEKFNTLVKYATVETVKKDGSISLIGSSLDLATTKLELSKYDSIVYFKVIEIIRKISESYDLTIIDTPPSIEMLTSSAINASDYVLLPIQLDLLAIKGATDIAKILVPTAHRYYNPNLKILGVIINLHRDTKAQRASKKTAYETFGHYLFNTMISRSEKVGQIATTRGTIDKSKSDNQFALLAEEIHNRILQDTIRTKKGGQNANEERQTNGNEHR